MNDDDDDADHRDDYGNEWWWYDNYIIESEFMYIIISFEIVYTTPDSMEKIFSVDILSTEGNTVINAMMYTVDIQI